MAMLDCTPLLNVADVERSLAFWREGLGFEVVATWDHEGRAAFARLRSGKAELMLNRPTDVDRPGPGAKPSYSDVVLNLRVDDVHALWRALTAKGLSVKPPERQFYGVDEMLMRDPDGYEIAFTSGVVTTGSAPTAV